MSERTVLLVVGLVIIAILAVALFRVRKVLSKAWPPLRKAFGFLWEAWCWIHIIPWLWWFSLRTRLARAILTVVTIVSFSIVGKSLLILLHRKEFSEHVPWVSPSGVSGLTEFPLWVEVSAFVLSLLLAWHYVHEWKAGLRRYQLPRTLQGLVRRFGQSEKKGSALTADEKRTHFESLMADFRQVLEIRRRHRISVSLMEERAGKLVVTFTHLGDPKDSFNLNLRLDKGQGGAGIAYGTPTSVYIPSVRHLIAINAEESAPLEALGTYERQDDNGTTEPFRSLLCVPVVGKTSVVGVLTFASRRRNAFSPDDCEIMRLSAVFVSFFFD